MIRRFPVPLQLLAAALLPLMALAGCSGSDDGALDVAFMEGEGSLFADGVRLSQGGQHVRAATRSGLVALDQYGEVVPALADRWNVTEGGSIFVFRLRDGTWPDGEDISAESVRLAMNRAIRELRGTSLGLDLSPIDDIRAMAGRVVEIRLASPMPDLLRLLAQPELGLSYGGSDTGLMTLKHPEGGPALLSLKPPTQRGLPEEENWQENVRDIRLHALSASDAVKQFDDGALDVVLGGRLASLPLADTGPLSRGTVRLDPAVGLFGLQVRRARGVLDQPETREAIAMAIDRPALAAVLNVGDWTPTTRVIAPGVSDDSGLVAERWTDLSIEERRRRAAARIAQWQGDGEPADARTLAIDIGNAPGEVVLFDELRRQLATIGVALVRPERPVDADLSLVDRVARYEASRWFLNQFNCLLDQGLCSREADTFASEALDETDPATRTRLLGEAEGALTLANVYIPFGTPLRWSLVRGNVEGFSVNRWDFHPLPDMAVIPR